MVSRCRLLQKTSRLGFEFRDTGREEERAGRHGSLSGRNKSFQFVMVFRIAEKGQWLRHQGWGNGGVQDGRREPRNKIRNCSEIRGDTLSIELTAGEMMAEDDAKENQSGKNNNLLHPVI